MAYAASTRPRFERETIDAAMARITTVARVMDALFVIPGTGIRVGFDAILGLVPVADDLLAQAIATYIIREAHQLGVGNALAHVWQHTHRHRHRLDPDRGRCLRRRLPRQPEELKAFAAPPGEAGL